MLSRTDKFQEGTDQGQARLSWMFRARGERHLLRALGGEGGSDTGEKGAENKVRVELSVVLQLP